jgi:L-threonylcarbamoyladenylate synthase
MEKPNIHFANPRTLRRCRRLINKGELVAFPTETVYGLGANALHPEAVRKIFEWKGRPSTNPVIVHFSKIEQLANITRLTPLEYKAMLAIGQECWPGPLTLVLRASSLVPVEVTAGKNFVGVRMPRDSVALSLINASQCLIAAPSANISGHCSPYTPKHVADDFYNKNLMILADSENISERCGIESSVMKLEEVSPGVLKITVLRTGFIGGKRIARILKEKGIIFNLEYYERLGKEDTPMDCPGQLFRHYAPKIPAYVENDHSQNKITLKDLKHMVVIGANGSLSELSKKCLCYYDLGPSVLDVAKNIYSILRLAEEQPNAKGIVISIKNLGELVDTESDLDKAITDKLLRCSEGQTIKIVK